MNSEVNPDTESGVDVRILKTATCPSLSGKSTLTYNIGCNTAGEIQFQVINNTGSGFHNKDWIPQSRIQVVLDKLTTGKALTSATFRLLFVGKSLNSSGFLLAVLQHVGLVRARKDKHRGYELQDPKDFIAEVNALLESTPETAMAATANAAIGGRKPAAKGKSKRA